MTLTVYLALTVSGKIQQSEFTVLLILMILFAAVFFSHRVVRLCLLVYRPQPEQPVAHEEQHLGIFAVPEEPIRVVLARDEEEGSEVGQQAIKKPKPPPYGAWRQSVRVDPDRIYWQRNPNAVLNEPLPARGDSRTTEMGNPGASRPPSYASEDGVDYVVEARPRSIAPAAMMEMPTPLTIHPSEVGRLNGRQAPCNPLLYSQNKIIIVHVMSSLSRRACYKCGNVGHYAEVCSSAERLCYNCKQPGHESNGCPLPRTTEAKQCYHCQGLGHVQADCPTLRLSGAGTSGRCYNCGQPGHLARTCPTPAGVGLGRGAPVPRGGYGGFARGGFAGGPRPATCYKCGGPNHFARDCQAQAMKCYACGKLGHISRDCTAPNGGPLNTAGKTCYQCGEAGHISRDCPQKVANGEIPNDVVDLNTAANLVPPVAPLAPVA
ncbi:hypothetical protein VD0002_g4405 [Verticillium dahliae]|uniref:CCHC-type domain-containing protein n=5 Tax=Verticillium TaxID=1036719 RepID=A0AA44WR82_VERDA|nr:hypothetical protein BJF96_g1543 [Verticillium dahliae]PNH39557.1 hypothetical protein VD0004_g7351 [Verticillium dahliae]PNH51120.1 hypothetical protein VD0003_g6092 [Verticillium dahliae]PNH64181.1 hypothetical protein VD0002_g4405 [Verticillium dahliae]PNH72440.1 hypothetical protein VD0001_g5123 [Verticillium dahliae]